MDLELEAASQIVRPVLIHESLSGRIEQTLRRPPP
jgi:hypothetical protein